MCSSNSTERGDSQPTPIIKQNNKKEQTQNIGQEHNSQVTELGNIVVCGITN
jgi:hypothetical protein